MSAQTRWFVADDRDGSITYSGTWSSIDGSQYNGEGNFGETFLNTLHRTTTTGSSMSFTFTGDAARIMGTTAVKNAKTTLILIGNATSMVKKRKKSRPISTRRTTGRPASSMTYPLGSTPYGLTFTTNGEPFLLDQIQYKPQLAQVTLRPTLPVMTPTLRMIPRGRD